MAELTGGSAQCRRRGTDRTGLPVALVGPFGLAVEGGGEGAPLTGDSSWWRDTSYQKASPVALAGSLVVGMAGRANR